MVPVSDTVTDGATKPSQKRGHSPEYQFTKKSISQYKDTLKLLEQKCSLLKPDHCSFSRGLPVTTETDKICQEALWLSAL